jgi:hypothetical protein
MLKRKCYETGVMREMAEMVEKMLNKKPNE